MGYIIGLVFVLLLIPLLFMVLSRRSASHGGTASGNRGMTPDRPTSDQPTPRPGPGVDPRIPPG